MRERGGGGRESNSLLTLPVGKSSIPFFIQECFHACVAGCGYKVSFCHLLRPWLLYYSVSHSLLTCWCGYCSLRLTHRKLIKYDQTGHLHLPLLRSHSPTLSDLVSLLRTCPALQHSQRDNANFGRNLYLKILLANQLAGRLLMPLTAWYRSVES